MKFVNITRRMILADNGRVVLSFFGRLKGLLFSDTFPTGQGLIIKPCSSVHTFGMSYCIDILFIDYAHTVVKTVRAMKPCRIVGCMSSAYVIELPAGTVERTATIIGDKVKIHDAYFQ